MNTPCFGEQFTRSSIARKVLRMPSKNLPSKRLVSDKGPRFSSDTSLDDFSEEDLRRAAEAVVDAALFCQNQELPSELRGDEKREKAEHREFLINQLFENPLLTPKLFDSPPLFVVPKR